MQLDELTEDDLARFLNHLHEVGLDLIGILLLAEPKPTRQTAHVRIDSDTGVTECVTAQDVCGLSSHTWQRQKILEPFGHLAAKPIHQRLGASLYRLSLVAVETGGPNLFLENRAVQTGPVGGFAVFPEQNRRYAIHPLVGTLRRQNQ